MEGPLRRLAEEGGPGYACVAYSFSPDSLFVASGCGKVRRLKTRNLNSASEFGAKGTHSVRTSRILKFSLSKIKTTAFFHWAREAADHLTNPFVTSGVSR